MAFLTYSENPENATFLHVFSSFPLKKHFPCLKSLRKKIRGNLLLHNAQNKKNKKKIKFRKHFFQIILFLDLKKIRFWNLMSNLKKSCFEITHQKYVILEKLHWAHGLRVSYRGHIIVSGCIAIHRSNPYCFLSFSWFFVSFHVVVRWRFW